MQTDAGIESHMQHQQIRHIGSQCARAFSFWISFLHHVFAYVCIGKRAVGKPRCTDLAIFLTKFLRIAWRVSIQYFLFEYEYIQPY